MIPSTMVGTESSKICQEVEPSARETTTDEIAIATIYNDKTNTFWKNTDVPFKTIFELQSLLKSIPKTKSVSTLPNFIDKIISNRKHEYTLNDEQSFINIDDIM